MKPSKRTVGYALVLGVAIVASSCASSSGTPADPPGTLSINIEDNGRISFESEQCGYGAPSSTGCSPGCVWSYVAVFFVKSNLNLSVVAVSDCASKYSEFQIADVGSVAGLAEVTNKSPLGLTSATAAQVGHGYLMRYTKAGAGTQYVRLFIDGWLTSADNGGIMGVRTKYQAF